MKPHKVFTFFIFSMALVLSGIFLKPAQARDDWELWTPLSVNYKITDDLTFKILPQARFQDDFKEHYYWETAQGFSYSINEYVDVGLYHLYAEKDREKGRSDSKENRLRTELTLKTKFNEYAISDRSRYEWRDIDGSPASRYRNRIQIQRPVTVFGQVIVPYVSNEFFYDLRDDEFNQNRGVLGFSKKINRHLKTGLFYMIKSTKSGSDWSEAHIVGTKVDIYIN